MRVLLREIEHDRDGFREDEVVVDEDRQLAGGVQREELGAAMLELGDVDVDELELDLELAQHPEDAQRAGRGIRVELHGFASRRSAVEPGSFWPKPRSALPSDTVSSLPFLSLAS